MVKIDILQWCAHELMLGAETLVSRSWLTRNTTLEILREPRSQMSQEITVPHRCAPVRQAYRFCRV